MREVIEVDDPRHFPGERPRIGDTSASRVSTVARQVLADADALLLPDEGQNWEGPRRAQWRDMVQRDLAFETRRSAHDCGIWPSLPAGVNKQRLR